jgi:hypothetical protein
MKRLLFSAALAVLVVQVSGCDGLFEPAPGRVTVATDRTSYSYGDTARVTIASVGRSPASIPRGSAGCFVAVERRQAAGWSAPQQPWTCDMVFVPGSLEPGETVELELELEGPSFAESGEYRFRFIEPSRRTRSTPSDPFSFAAD